MNSYIRGMVREEPSYMTCDKQYITAKDVVEKANHKHRRLEARTKADSHTNEQSKISEGTISTDE